MEGKERERKGKSSQFKKRKRKPCIFCIDDKKIDFKDVAFVRRFMTDRGKIAPRRLSGCCALHQRMVATAVKRSREVGLVPYMVD
ncbi:30S ribosomal protein S18 [candidate division WOR-1 bacterium RIFOXYA12_FULL_52_29]|uniref:Small ribosomal subunit protein bS18 n=1 Tax=candidate division WOR-1 bacterium RIFOXYC12_FULL_54_18 TaxID=1802584 RepID=A0A1F4T6P8_UNCSA|nr:MAG: 30S ribosomal protein S18 [Alphaproteobacteria bacterium RIFOXYD12_FULL_60_8]OGC11907.1 MAG: 30S ribosomal protein S18 [candidate division WOR-1 bacterium RIFOXYA2_FULL_51_19]OGC17981.1 MAG: 30S ribosomal protein S18 [candidate division WOR-1 bacterium RIFOXYA12_FULL_52_29]OGC26837.1 MAG: 30S ribosomal protein S18 [candidate division WOR-1 bacterium RIFOXYB2_FULL_45_9]OGC28398.1 MAG: 30S ribosomal protein S18 [candidate division WOR-1 bacterium RIFOXYC12_FULL_54_18]OGC31147.1 MAG: 30S 